LWFRFYSPSVAEKSAPPLRSVISPWIPGPHKKLSMLAQDRFVFLNEEGGLAGPESWNDPSREKLWLYNLHYFDDLIPDDVSERVDWHRRLIQRWVVENPVGSGNGWEPYPLSLRMVNWIKWALQGNEMEPAWLDSLATQTRFLRKRLEYHLLGNHLLANARALVFAGLFFAGEEAEAWLAKGLEIYTRQLPEQVLDDGGHFERSPMYHAIVLEDLLDLVNILSSFRRKPESIFNSGVEQNGSWIRHAGPRSGTGMTGEDKSGMTGEDKSGMTGGADGLRIRHAGPRSGTGMTHPRHPGAANSGTRDLHDNAGTGEFSHRAGMTALKMLTWLRAMTHPDGGIGFFNDTALGIAPGCAALESYAGRLGLQAVDESSAALQSLAASGYVRLQQGPLVALLDVGETGPDYLPGHAHADTLSFELSLFGQRVFCNSGTSSYTIGAQRQRQRGTAAHNTVVIDGEDSSEVWAGFRVARRARPFGLNIDETGGGIAVACSHDGYKRLKGRPVHTRQWHFEPGRMAVTDNIQGGFKSAVAYYHLHPGVRACFDDEGNGRFEIAGGRTAKWSVTGGQVSIEGSTYHPEFGLSISNQVIKVVFGGSKVVFSMQWGEY